jgi:hypothetical protein
MLWAFNLGSLPAAGGAQDWQERKTRTSADTLSLVTHRETFPQFEYASASGQGHCEHCSPYPPQADIAKLPGHAIEVLTSPLCSKALVFWRAMALARRKSEQRRRPALAGNRETAIIDSNMVAVARNRSMTRAA